MWKQKEVCKLTDVDAGIMLQIFFVESYDKLAIMLTRISEYCILFINYGVSTLGTSHGYHISPQSIWKWDMESFKKRWESVFRRVQNHSEVKK